MRADALPLDGLIVLDLTRVLAAYFCRVNAGKESVALGLGHPRGREVVLDLARHADVFHRELHPGRGGQARMRLRGRPHSQARHRVPLHLRLHHLDGEPVHPRGPAAYRVGEHMREVLAGLLGYDDGRVKNLLAAGVIAAP